MKNGFIIHSLIAAFLGLGLGETAWAVSGQGPVFLWPELGHGHFLLLGMGTALAFAWAQAAFWRLAFFWDFLSGLKIASFSLVPALIGFAWPLVIKAKLPVPHDFPLRNLQILLAAQCLLPLLISLALGVAGLWRSRSLHFWRPRTLALRLGGLALVVYFLSGIWVGQWNNTGDAPHYLLISYSLVHDRDVDLANNYERKDWRHVYDRELKAQEVKQKDGRKVSEHKPGLPLLLAPGLKLMGLSGARWTLGVLAAWGTAMIYLLCLSMNFSRGQAFWGWALFSFSAPWWVNSQLAMAELPGGLCFLVVALAWKGVFPRVWAALACAAMFWLNVRYFPAALLMAGMISWRQRNDGGFRALWPLAIAGLSLALALFYNLLQFGHISPAEAHAQRGLGFERLFQPRHFLRYSSGLMIDQQYGWLPYAPAFALSFLGLWSWWQRDRPIFWASLLPALVYVLPVANFFDWWSQMGPNRYLVCLTPFFLIWALEAWRSWGNKPAFMALAGLSFFWGAALTVLPWFCWGNAAGENQILRILGGAMGLNLSAWFPTFMRDDPKGYIWVLALLAALAFTARKLGRPSQA